ncbi:MAG: hypothetical protein WD225_04510 [Ilumatobacteraceae bacterium]
MPARLFPRLARRVVAVSAVVALMGSVSVLSTSPERDRVLAADVLGAGGEFHPLEPQRVLDTRAGVNIEAGSRPLLPGEGQAFEVSLSGQGGLPEMDLAPGDDGAEAGTSGDHPVLAVALSVTVVEPTQRGYLRAFGSDEEEGTSSIVNFSADETVPNMTILAPGADGSITVRLVSEGAEGSEGTAHVLIDVFGWFSKGTYSENGSRLIPVGPGRIFDSRNPTFGGDPVGPGEFVEVPVAGADSLDPEIADIVPDSDGVTGALVNVTGVNQGSGSEPTFVSVVPDEPADGVPPTTSNLNLRADHVKANLVMVPVGPDGSIWLYNSAGDTHLVVDVVAYLEPRPVDTRVGRVIPLRQPLRVLDTRQDEFGALRLGAGQGEDWTFRCFVADVRIGEDWVGSQSAFLGNLTATGLEPSPDYPEWGPDISSYLTVYPSSDDSSTPPEASNLNIAEGESVANAALFRYGSREVEGEPDPYSVRVYNFEGEVHYLVDAAAVVLEDDDEAERADCSAG